MSLVPGEKVDVPVGLRFPVVLDSPVGLRFTKLKWAIRAEMRQGFLRAVRPTYAWNAPTLFKRRLVPYPL